MSLEQPIVRVVGNVCPITVGKKAQAFHRGLQAVRKPFRYGVGRFPVSCARNVFQSSGRPDYSSGARLVFRKQLAEVRHRVAHCALVGEFKVTHQSVDCGAGVIRFLDASVNFMRTLDFIQLLPAAFLRHAGNGVRRSIEA